MKLSNIGIIFFIIFLCIMVRVDVKEKVLVALTNQKIQIDNQLDNAVDDAMSVLVEFDSKNNTKINHKKSVDMFYKSLEANFGVLDDKTKRELLKVYVPVILITTNDGFYINYNRLDNGVLVNTWTEKFPYIKKEDKVYRFYAGEERENISIVENKTTQKGKWDELGLEYPERMRKDFDQYRRDVIIDCITEKMQYYMDQNNYIAKNYGIAYTFRLPNIEKDDWKRTIDDISFMVLFQGYQYGTYSTMRYNRYTVAGARTHKEDMYYIQYDQSSGRNLYHRYNCDKVTDFSQGFFTKRQCAVEGAFACPHCKP